METESVKKSDFFSHHNMDLQEYLLVIEPCSEVYNKVLEERRFFEKEYGELPEDDMHRFIKVAGFLANESMEDTLIRWITRICRLQQSFTLSLNNYSGFPQHSVFLRIQDTEPLHSLFKQLRIIEGLINSSGGSPLQLVARPHLVIARNLSSDVYNKAITEYARKTFHESFEVSQLLLIKNDVAYDTKKLVNVFGLTPVLNTIKV